MKHDISVLDALRSLIDYAEEENLSAAKGVLVSMLEDVSRRFDPVPARHSGPTSAQIIPFMRRSSAG